MEKEMKDVVRRALFMAVDAHSGQTDLGGHPYILHPISVAMMANTLNMGPKAEAVALLHDVVEDTRYTLNHIEHAGFPEDVIEAVDHITRRDSGGDIEVYRNYIERCAENELAREVKMLDIMHNSRLDRVPEEMHDRIKGMIRGRWKRALKTLGKKGVDKPE